MALRSLSSKEIEVLIAEDKIVWVSCRDPHLQATQGKFVRGRHPIHKGGIEFPYAFCPYKKGLNLPFLPADCWLINEDSHSHQQSINETLAMAFGKTKGK